MKRRSLALLSVVIVSVVTIWWIFSLYRSPPAIDILVDPGPPIRVEQGGTVFLGVTVVNSRGFRAKARDVRGEVGLPEGFILGKSPQLYFGTVSAGDGGGRGVRITVPSTVEAGEYHANLTIWGSNVPRKTADIVIQVSPLGSLAEEATGPVYFYPTQYFECTVYGNGSKIHVSHAITVYCLRDVISQIDITILYGENEVVEVENMLEVFATAGKVVDRTVDQTANQTNVCIQLPEKLHEGDDGVVILKYWIHDLPGDVGLSRPVRSLWDILLGRRGGRFSITYKPGIFEDRVDELIVKLYPPLDYLPLSCEPRSIREKWYDPATGRVAILWHLKSGIPRVPEFRVVCGKPMWSDPMVRELVIVGLLTLIGVFVVVGLVVFVCPRRARTARRGL